MPLNMREQGGSSFALDSDKNVDEFIIETKDSGPGIARR